MKRYLFFLQILFIGCVGSAPTKEDIVGTWQNPDGAEFSFKEDGSFKGKLLPAEYFTFFTSKKEIIGKRINGNGKWNVEKGQGRWKLNLEFEERNNEIDPAQYFVLLSRTGDFETGDSWYLFRWVEEEGGNRYMFERK